MNIIPGTVEDARVAALLAGHREEMHAYSPPENVHALTLDGLRDPLVSLWCAWDGEDLLGCGALKDLGDGHGEIKSMRTAVDHRRRGVGRALLLRILEEAGQRGYRRISLETGAHPAFGPALALYARHGFEPCDAFAPYQPDPHSVFMSRVLQG